MYGSNQQSAAQGVSLSPPKASNPTVAQTHLDTAEYLQSALISLDRLLAKVRGAHPEENQKNPEEMPTVLATAGKLRQLAYAINSRLEELHAVIGD